MAHWTIAPEGEARGTYIWTEDADALRSDFGSKGVKPYYYSG